MDCNCSWANWLWVNISRLVEMVYCPVCLWVCHFTDFIYIHPSSWHRQKVTFQWFLIIITVCFCPPPSLHREEKLWICGFPTHSIWFATPLNPAIPLILQTRAGNISSWIFPSRVVWSEIKVLSISQKTIEKNILEITNQTFVFSHSAVVFLNAGLKHQYTPSEGLVV